MVKELVYSNGTYKNRADVVFFINGIPVIIAENKNAKDENGFEKDLTQVIRYSHETPELLLPAQMFVLNEGLNFSMEALGVLELKYFCLEKPRRTI